MDIEVIQPKWKKIWVKNLKTGKIEPIKDARFNPAIHERTLLQKEEEALEVVEAEEVLDDLLEEVTEENVHPEFWCEPCEKQFKRAQDLKSHKTMYHKI